MNATKRTPKYRLHKPTGLALVELNGRRIYIGKYNTPASRAKYHRLVAEWVAGDHQAPIPSNDVHVVELVRRFMLHAKGYYRKPDGTKTNTLYNYKAATRILRRLYGRTLVSEFDARCLKTCRQAMIDKGWCRGTVNKTVNLIRGVFRWGVSEGLLPVNVYTTLQTLRALERGRSKAKDNPPVEAVPDKNVDAIADHVPRPVWGLIRLQRITGARGGELFKLRAADLDTSGDVWTATIGDHKTAHIGKRRTLFFGPQAQQVLKEFMGDRATTAYLFSPRDVVRKAPKGKRRREGQPESPRKTKRTVTDYYDSAAYGRCITRACEAAKVSHWSPHQLRHSAAGRFLREFDIKTVSVMLGHAHVNVSELYAGFDRDKAIEVARRIG